MESVSACHLNVLVIKTAWPGYGRNECCAVSRKHHNVGWNNAVDIGILTRLGCVSAFVSFYQWNFPTVFVCSNFSSSFTECLRRRFIPRQNELLILLGDVFGRPSPDASQSFQNKPSVELSGVDAFRRQCSGHCILTLHLCHNYVLWTRLDPCFKQTNSYLTLIEPITGHRNTFRTCDITYSQSLLLTRKILLNNQPEKSIAAYTQSVINHVSLHSAQDTVHLYNFTTVPRQ